MTRHIVAHGRTLNIVAQTDLPAGSCGVALAGESGVPLWVQQGPCAAFREDEAVQVLDTARARVYDALERMHDALAREAPAGPSLPVLALDQPMRRWRWLPAAIAGGAVLAALLFGAWHQAALVAGPLMLVLLVVHFIAGMARKPPHLDLDVNALGWPTLGWGLGAFVFWGGYSEAGEPTPSAGWLVLALPVVAMAGLAVGHWLRGVLLTSDAAPSPLPVILSPAAEAPAASDPALYSVGWYGKVYPSLGVPCPPGLALLPLDAAIEQPEAIPRFAQRVLRHREAYETSEERRREIHSRVASVEDALRELDASR